jgi:hypothetical protein
MAQTFLLLALAGTLAAQPSDRARSGFPDGTGLEIHTESTGSSQIASMGAIGIGPGAGSQDLVNREVIDRENNVLFIYNIEASRGSSPGTVLIRIEPISPAMEANFLDRKGAGSLKFTGPHLPTVASVREFPSVRIGEVVTLDILYNPSTGERIYDVLRPITDASPRGKMLVTGSRTPQQISLREITVRVNGQVAQAPAAWMIGAAARIDIPGHGAYIVAAYDPQNSSPGYAFRPIAHADGKILSWTMDGEYLEITSSANALTQAVNGVLWVYHDPRYRSQDQPDAVRLQTADTVEWLLPKR